MWSGSYHVTKEASRFILSLSDRRVEIGRKLARKRTVRRRARQAAAGNCIVGAEIRLG